MGIFSGIGDAIGDFFGGIVEVIDKITGGGFSKLLGNKWFKGAMMAVSIVTGGIAIANGIMAAGQAGLGKAVADFAANMSMETGGKLVSSVIDTGAAFIGGVKDGLLDPMGSDAGQGLQGMLDGATANITGQPLDSATLKQVPGTAGESGNFSPVGETDPTAAFSENVDRAGEAALSGGQPPSLEAIQQTAQGTVAPEGSAFGDALAPANQEAYMAGGSNGNLLDPADFAAGTMHPGAEAFQTDALTQAMQGAQGEPGILSRMATGAKDYASSPGGMQTIGKMLQGYASGQAVQERWDDMRKDEKRTRSSWTDGTFVNPRFGPSKGG